MAYLSDYNTAHQYKAIVLNTKRLTPDNTEEVREIILEVQDPLFKCQVDQCFGVLVRYDSPFGKNIHHRFYSVADLPDVSKKLTTLTMLVKRCSYVDDFSGESMTE